ncbi:MAG TPA: hemopexin repeat-containing protein [Kofleriaceae bacterium]
MSTEPETNYTTLFGSMDHAEGNEARSVLSPAAYLVDLLQLRDSVIHDLTMGYHARRPDVQAIRLDQASTFTEIPFLDVANAVMSAALKQVVGGTKDIDTTVNHELTSNRFPPPLPFSEQHLRLQVYAEKLGTHLEEIERLYRTAVDAHRSARLRLGLSQEEYDLFSTPHDEEIAALWGVDPGELDGSDLELIKKQLGLSLKELKQLVRQDLSESELNATANNAAASFFINQGPYVVLDEQAHKLQVWDGTTATQLTNRHLDRMMRLVRLARRLDVGLVDLDWLIQTACGNVLDGDGLQALAIALAIRKTSDWPIDEICSLWSVPRRHGQGDGPVAADLFDRVYDNDFPKTLKALVGSLRSNATADALDDRLQATLRLSGADFAFLKKALLARGAEMPRLDGESKQAYEAFYDHVVHWFSACRRIVELSRLLSVDVREVVTLLDVLGAQWAVSEHEDLAVPLPFAAEAPSATPPTMPFKLLLEPSTPPFAADQLRLGTLDVLQKLIRVKEWLDSRQLSVRQLAYICLEDHVDARERLKEMSSAPIDGVQPDDEIETALDDLYQALRDSMLAPGALQTGSLSANGARAVFDSLREARVLIAVDAPDRALLRVLPSNHELAEAMQRGIHERLELHAGDFAALGITESDPLFSLLVSHGYVERLDETVGGELEVHHFIAPGLESYFSAPDSAARFTIANFQDHAEAVFSALAQRVDAARVEPAALIAAGIDSLDVPALFEVLRSRNYVEQVPEAPDAYRVAAGARDLFRNPANGASFVLPNFAAVFAILAAKVEAFRRAQDNCDAEANELGERLKAFSEQQTRASIRSLCGLLGLAEDLTEVAFGWAFGTPDEEMTQTLATLTLPLFRAKSKKPPEPPEPALGDAYVASRFRRLQQLALLLRKTAMTAEEAQVYLANQRVHRRLPEALKLPEGFLPASGRIDALTTLPNGDFLIINNLTGKPLGPKYVAFSRHDYHLLGNMDTLDKIPGVQLPTDPLDTIPGVQLPNDPPDTFCKRVLNSGIDAAFSDTVDGKPVLHLCAGDRYVTVSETGTSAASPETSTSAAKPITDWGRVRNNIQDTARVDAAVQAKDGRLFLFSGDQYFVYSDPRQLLTKQTFVNERYPRSIRGKFECENVFEPKVVSPLPAPMFSGVDAAFRDTDDTYFFFSGNRFTHSTDPYNLLEIRPIWGHVRNYLFEECRVDAAFVLGGVTYLTRKNQLTRYSGAYQIVDETFPISFLNVPESEPLLRVLRYFPDGLDAALAGSDGRLYAFKGGNYASSAAPDTSLTIRDRWGRVRNVFIDNQRVDAALALNGVVYLFCGDQYVRYSGSDYTYVDEGHPLRVRPSWNARERIGLVPDGLPLPITAVAVGRAPGGTSDDVYFFGGHQYAGLDGALCEIQAHWARVRNNIERTGVVDAAMLDGAGRMYLFSGDQLYRYSSPEQAFCDESYPRRLAVAWAQAGNGYSLPDAFAGGISAALRTDEGSVFLFSGQRYARADVAQTEPPRANSQDWGLVRNEIQSKNAVSAAYVDPAGKTYVFGGDQFVCYSGTAYDFVDEGFPLAIATRWPTLPVDFRSDIDAALSFKSPVDGVQRLYLFKGDRYARFSSGDLTQLDAGYPKQNLDAVKAEGLWFRGLAVHEPNPGSSHQDDPIVSLEAAYADTAGGQPGIVVFYRHEGGVQWRREYRNGNWQAPKRMDDLTDYQPFTRLDAAFVSADGTLHAFSDNRYASRPPGGSALTMAVPIRSRWGRVWNQFADLGRVDACLNMGDGRTYLFCARQYIKYTGPLRPGAPDFFAVEGYPRRIDPGWPGEGVPVALAPEFQAAGYDLCRDATGKVHFFNGARTTFSGNPGPDVLLTSRWGKVENRFQDLDRVDGAYRAENGKLYLFCDTQYTRYSGPVQPDAPDFWADEGYPLRIATGWRSEGLATAMPAQWSALGSAVFRDAKRTYVFQGSSYTRSQVSTSAPVIPDWANVRNLIQSDNRVDAGLVLARGAGAVTLLFRGDQYVRYSGGYDGPVDEGYPKAIAHLEASDGVFPGLPVPLQSGLRALFAGTDDKLHAFGPQPPDESQPQLCVSSANPGVLRPLNEQWGIVDNKLWDNELVDAALLASNGKLYLFSGDQYVQYSGSDRTHVDEGYPQKIASSYAQKIGAAALAPILNQGVDAALTIGNTTFYFAQNKYVSSEHPEVAQPLVDRWGLVDNRLQAGRKLDAAFVAPNGKLYLFAEHQVSVYSGASREWVDEESPRTIAADLGGQWPPEFRANLDTAVFFEGRSYLFQGARHVRISDYRLTKADKGYPLDNTSKLVDRFDFELGALPDWWRIKQRFDDHASQATTLLDYASQATSLLDDVKAPMADPVSRLAQATLWPQDEILAVLQIYQLDQLEPPALLDCRVVARLARCFELADRMQTLPSKLDSEVWQKMFGSNAPSLAAAADFLHGLIKAATSSKDWPGVARSLQDLVQSAKRDALVAYLVKKLDKHDANDLYEHLLTDVQMDASSSTSKIVEAINSIQLFYHRALIQLESFPDDGPPDPKDPSKNQIRTNLKSWWPWMKNYRIWEANRKVFLHPENYIRPELRPEKSPAFQELEDKLLQDEITKDTVQDSYRRYLESFNEIAQLRIVGGYRYTYRDDSDKKRLAVAMFGATRTDPPVYYYRIGEVTPANVDAKEPIDWEPWQKVGITIDSDRVQPVYAFNRLFIFWIETRPFNSTAFSSSSKESYSADSDSAKMVQLTVKFSFYNFTKEWVAPQTLCLNPNDPGDPEVLPTLYKKIKFWFITIIKQISAILPAAAASGVRLTARTGALAGGSQEDVIDLAFLRGFEEWKLGRLTSGLDLVLPEEADWCWKHGDILSDLAIHFPSQIGIHPRELSAIVPWDARVEEPDSEVEGSDTKKGEWFSFDAKGGTFLCRPTTAPAPTPGQILSHSFSGVSAAFTTDSGDVFVFTSEKKDEKDKVNKLCYYYRDHFDLTWQGPVFVGDPAWPWGRPEGVFRKYPDKRIENVIVALDGTTYFLLGTGHFRYPKGGYFATIERYATELRPGSPTLEQLVGKDVPALTWDGSVAAGRSLVRAFKLPGEARAAVVTQAGGKLGMVTVGLDELRQASGSTGASPFDNWDGLDTVFQVGSPERVVFSYRTQLAILDWSLKIWTPGALGDLPGGAAGLSAAFSGIDDHLYYFCGDRYAEVPRDSFAGPQNFDKWVDRRWGRPSLFSWLLSSVDGALRGPDGKLYLFCKEYCLTYTGVDPITLDTLACDTGVTNPPKVPQVSQVWLSPVGERHGVEQVTAAFERNGRAYLFGKQKQKDGDAFVARYSQGSQSPFHPDSGYPLPIMGISSLSVDFYARLLTADQKYMITRLTSHTSEQLGRRLFARGIPGLLSLETQRQDELPSFTPLPKPLPNPPPQAGPDELFVNTEVVSEYPGKPPPSPSPPVPSSEPPPLKLDFASANGFYYREIFFHIPYLIAQTLRQGQKFDEARRWYEYVFDPTNPANAQFWQYVEFVDDPGRDLKPLADQVRSYRTDPFDPHKIAELRPIAYRKAFVMSYIGNLLDWGDMLFRQYTRESIGEATMLYVLAADLLGKKPEELGKRAMQQADSLMYEQIASPDYTDIALTDEILMLENGVPPPTSDMPKTIQTPNDSIFNTYFYIPENADFVEYWKRVDDRLSKIRHGLDIDGIKRSLALFAPPVDVMALVKAFASGAGLAETLADYSAPVPHYRFAVMLARARELTGRLIGLGGALLAALEKKDAEELSQLRNTQERSILEMQLEIKQQQLAGAQESLAGLQEGLKNAKAREKHYQDLLAEGLSMYEQAQIAGMIISQVFSQGANAFSLASSIANYTPQFGSLFAITYGGQQIGAGLGELAQSFRAQAETASFGSSLAATLGGWERRAQDWELQKTLATGDTLQIGRQIKAAEIQVEVARQDVQVQRRMIKNNQSVDTFMNSKFTSQQLYQWMAGKLSAVYFQTYHLAHQYAKAAQRAMQFELGLPESDVQYIGAGYWDSLKKGLTAGEQLQLDLDRLEKAQLEANERRMEITKYVSLAQVDPLALLHLKERGTCEFELGEALFDADFPGHYGRQIKTVSLSFPALIGPYHNFNATLTQLGHRTLLAPDKARLNYLLGKTTTTALDASVLRIDWRPNQQIALSTGTNDSGLFEVNYHDERYLPFEGTGAVSTWRLEINGVDGPVHRQTLSDVILTVRYTARSGGSAFAETVKNAVGGTSERAWLLNLATDFSDEWQAFLSKPSAGMAFTVERRNLPGASEKEVTGVYLHYEMVEDPVDDLSRQAIQLESGPAGPQQSKYLLKPGAFTKVELPLLEPGQVPAKATWTLMPTSASAAAKLSPRNLKTIGLVVTYAGKASF